MDFRKASVSERVDRLNKLSEPKAKVSQDTLDKAFIASSFLNISRCNKCLRLNNDGYVCIHCGADGSDDD
jgi:hypothetical protein